MTEKLPSSREEIECLVWSKVAECFSMLDVDCETDLRSEYDADDADIDTLLLWCYETYGVNTTEIETEAITAVEDIVVLLNLHRLNQQQESS